MEIIRKKEKPQKPQKKFPSLYPCFFKGTFKGQLDSVWKTRKTNPDKVLDFKKAIMNGDILFQEPLTPSQQKKCEELGIVPPSTPQKPRAKPPVLS